MYSCATLCDYYEARKKLLHRERSQILGSKIILTEKEQMVNEFLMRLKHEEIDNGFKNPEVYLPAQHFFKCQKKIDNSKVFKFIQLMPKGASLHGHDTAMISGDYLYELTFSDNLYGCIVNGRLMLKYFKVPDKDYKWVLVEELRKKDKNFNAFLKTQINIIRDKAFNDINDAWDAFIGTFMTTVPLLCYKPNYSQYFYDVLKELYDDKIMYMEFRTVFPDIYDLEGNILSKKESVELYIEVMKKFKKNHPELLGVKLIYAPVRDMNNESLADHIREALELKDAYPNFIAGFDLVGQEDKGKPLTDYLPLIQEASKHMDFFFHAGETNWYGTSTDLNLIDAVLLGTKRIGHGYALVKHPEAMKLVKEKNIAIEVCPISNQVLNLVQDIRNHPGTLLIAQDYPVVIGNDDPTFWGAKGLSYDFYFAFMAMADKTADLRLLKKLVLNSLEFSTFSEKEKKNAYALFKSQWDEFINDIIFHHRLM